MKHLFTLIIAFCYFQTFAASPESDKVIKKIVSDTTVSRLLSEYQMAETLSYFLIEKLNGYRVNNGVVSRIENVSEIDQSNAVHIKKMKIKDTKAKIVLSVPGSNGKISMKRFDQCAPWSIKSIYFHRHSPKDKKAFYWTIEI